MNSRSYVSQRTAIGVAPPKAISPVNLHPGPEVQPSASLRRLSAPFFPVPYWCLVLES